MIIQHANLLDLVLILIPYTYKSEFRTIVRCQVSFQSCKEREREKPKPRAKLHLKIPVLWLRQKLWPQIFGWEQQAASLSTSLIPRPPAGRLTTSGGLRKARRSTGENSGEDRGWELGRTGGAEVGNEPQDRGETESHPPTESGSLESPSNFQWLFTEHCSLHPQIRFRRDLKPDFMIELSDLNSLGN